MSTPEVGRGLAGEEAVGAGEVAQVVEEHARRLRVALRQVEGLVPPREH